MVGALAVPQLGSSVSLSLSSDVSLTRRSPQAEVVLPEYLVHSGL